ncbi:MULTISPECIES: hypothetical protein [unclassified Streptomyces]|uniref:hypothetical protein n=1 Tax=unclassified Streptomyces TaxID=2593676 RepID=UPI00225B3E92|nr:MULTISPECIES: hypothetical protein [unclassified Streptomyces]MCX4394863.1 hypothetical protein [Streptomyces sp. NBC_01767]MCX5102483.1 hypothetical protein [Streptomyces sp. NBC_00439]WSP47426.1 hypothetical protein OG348_16910 [Streptomyces sp. NBC_01243]
MATAGSGQQATGDGIGDAERARAELSDALNAAGVKLPSLSLDAVSCAGAVPRVLIDLGRCNVATAHALAAALRLRGAGRRQEAAR